MGVNRILQNLSLGVMPRRARRGAPARTRINALRVSRGARVSAFTWVELLVVTAILGLVIGVIASCIAAGLKVWDVAKNFHVAEAESFVGVEIVEKDISNTFLFSDIPFAGGVRQLSCATLFNDGASAGRAASAAALEERASDWRIGTVRYVMDNSRGELLRAVSRHSPSERLPLDMRSERVMRGIQDVAFSYLASPRGAENRETWQSEWTSATNLPRAVRLTVKGREGEVPFVMERLIVLSVHSGSSEGAQARQAFQAGK